MINYEDLNKIKKLLKNVKIHIIPYCHADYAWTHPRKWHVDRYKQIICEVLDVMNKNSEFCWMADNIYPMLWSCIIKEFSRYDEFWQRVKEGRIEITNGIMTLIRPTMTGDETFIRNIILGNEYMNSILPGFKSQVFHNVDVSIGHSQLPQMLKLGGYSFYRGWRPQGAMDAKKIPRQFIWVGNDDSSIICSRGTYAGFWQAEYMEKENFSDSDGSLVEFYNTELKDILLHSESEHIWVPFGMDDTLPMMDVKDNPINLDAFLEYFKKATESSVFYSNAANYFAGLVKSDLPVYKGILDPSDVGYNISSKGDKGLWHLRLLLDRLLVVCESLCTLAVLNGGIYPEKEINSIWNNLLLICSHGMEFVFAEDYETIYELAFSSVSMVKSLIEDAKMFLSKNMNNPPNPSYTLFNTLNWVRHDIILLPINSDSKFYSPAVKASYGNTLSHQLVFSGDYPTHILVETSVPSMSCTNIEINFTKISCLTENPQPENNSQLPIEIDTGNSHIVFECGAIKSVNGITHISDNDFFLGKVRFTELNQTPDDAWLYNNSRGLVSEMEPVDWGFEEFGPLRWKYVVTGTVGKYPVRQEIILTKGKSAIDFNLQLDCSQKESGFFTAAFPAGSNTEFVADIPFGIENRDIVNEPYGVVTDIGIDNLERLWEGVFYARSFINYSIEDINITLFATDCPRYYWYNKNEKSVSFILNRNYVLDECTDWMKDTHPWNESPGIISFSYSADIVSGLQTDNFLSIIKTSKEKQNPVEIIKSAANLALPKAITLPSYLDITSKSSVLSALYFNSGKFVLRLYNTSGLTDQVQISCFKTILSYKITDFLLNEIPEKSPFILSSDNCISFNAAPWEILTVVFEIRL